MITPHRSRTIGAIAEGSAPVGYTRHYVPNVWTEETTTSAALARLPGDVDRREGDDDGGDE